MIASSSFSASSPPPSSTAPASAPPSPTPSARPGTLVLMLPDWQHLDTVLRSRLPFVLWPVGDQPLLYHWLDHAVDRGFERVTLVCADRPAEVRKAMEQARLWPIPWELETVSSAELRPGAVTLDHLPDGDSPATPPADGWALLDYWFALQRLWFDASAAESEAGLRTLAIGRFCSIHPSVELRPPVWIDDYVQIGPGSVIGPYVSLGKGALIEGPTEIAHSVVTAHTFLAGHTELRDAYLEGGLLLNLRHRARVTGVDSLIANSLLSEAESPSLKSRAAALALFLAFSALARISGRDGEAKTIETFDGLELVERAGPLWRRRRAWLPKVVLGRLHLFGVLPRTSAQLDQLSEDWRELIRRAPRGVFAYSDLCGAHDPEDELEAVHAVFQATASKEVISELFKNNFWKLLRVG